MQTQLCHFCDLGLLFIVYRTRTTRSITRIHLKRLTLTFPYQQQVCSQRRQLLDSASSLRMSRTRQLPARHYQCKCSPNWRGRGNYFANKYFIDSFIRAHKQFIPLRGLKLALQRLPVCLSVRLSSVCRSTLAEGNHHL